MPDSLQRAVTAAEVGALEAQAVWTCGGDDVAPVLAMRPLIGSHASGFLLRFYWLPLAAVLLVITVLWALLTGLLG